MLPKLHKLDLSGCGRLRFTDELLSSPRSRTVRFSSPLGVYDFQKRSFIIHCTRESMVELGKHVANVASGEFLTAHARSAQMRVDLDSSPDDARKRGVNERNEVLLRLSSRFL